MNLAKLKRWRPLIDHKRDDVRFLVILLPILESIYQNLRQSIGLMPILQPKFSDARLAGHLRIDAIEIFLPMISKCCVIEMHTKRLNRELLGDTPEARFDHFIEQCTEQAMYEKLWSTYPVLATCLQKKAAYYEAAMLEFFQRLNTDLPEVERKLLGEPMHRLVKIQASGGDTHKHCRRVLIVHGKTKQGCLLRFVYKPRSLSNEVIFYKLCKWYSADIKTINFIDFLTHGYCQFIEYSTCCNESELHEFYYKLGELTALLLLINGLDLHQENIIACGKHPMLIDMECILTPVLTAKQYDYPNVGQSSVLPRQSHVTKKNKGLDISGMSANNDEQPWLKVSVWHKPGTDEMHLVNEAKQLKPQLNIPRVRGKIAEPAVNYQNDFISGFKNAYQTLLMHRDHLLSEGSPLFQKEPIISRILFRNTGDYATLLSESYHPLLLSSREAYVQHINWLDSILFYQPYFKDIVPAERDDLLNGDIPYFESYAHEKMIYNSRHESVNVPVTYTGLQQCKRMLKALSEEHLKAQCQLIELSFKAYHWNHATVEQQKAMQMRQGVQRLNQQSFLKHLIERATISEGFVGWAQLSLDKHQAWVGDLCDSNFYDGSMGIAFVLAYWDHFQQCPQSRKMTEQILKSCYLKLLEYPSTGFGLTGYAGLLYAAHQLHQCGYAEAGDIVELLLQSRQMTPSFHDEIYDVLYGVSQDITTLLSLKDSYPIDDAMIHDKMARLKERCPEPATFGHDEESFFINGKPHPPNLSYGHGIAGVAVAFSRYAKHFDDAFAKAWVMKTADLLDIYFDKQCGFWPDMREAPEVASLDELKAKPPAWCGGHVGIGLFYIECYLHWPELKERAQKRLNDCINISKSIANQPSSLPNLCCGFYGDLDFLHELNRRLPDIFSEVTAPILNKLDEKLLTHAFGLDFISLFRGIPSYLYTTLRTKHPKDMPSAIFW